MFKNKTLLITGGTGSFGNAVLDMFLESDIGEIRIFSRDEKKQDDMRKKYGNSKLKFYLGDVKDKNSIDTAVKGADFCFHAAALKQVPSCEFFPMQAVKTNIIGTENVLKSCIKYKVKKVVCLSTDKAVYPINAMGISKAMMEKVMIACSKESENSETVICGTRYGNVMGSRGSVIPLFLEQLEKNQPLTITDPKMTRFMMTINDAVDLVMYAFNKGKNGDIFVQKSPSATIADLVEAILKLRKLENYSKEIIGTRHGEKHYEVLMSREEKFRADDLGNYFRIHSDNRDLNYSKFVERGDKKFDQTVEDYNSNNTKKLKIDEVVELLKKM